jgi:hypothetical protein
MPRMTSVRALALLSSAVLLAACGGSGDYAGENRDQAEQEALDALVLQVNEPGSDVYHHHVRLRSATKSVEPDGREAWKVVIADTTAGVRFCVYTRLVNAAVGVSPLTDVGDCSRG